MHQRSHLDHIRSDGTMSDKLALIRSIVVSAEIEAGKDLRPGVSAAIAWRTIGQIRKVLADDENRPSNLVIAPRTSPENGNPFVAGTDLYSAYESGFDASVRKRAAEDLEDETYPARAARAAQFLKG